MWYWKIDKVKDFKSRLKKTTDIYIWLKKAMNGHAKDFNRSVQLMILDNWEREHSPQLSYRK